MMHENKIPFGERDGALFRAFEVENGLRCNCICPGCRQPLNAANNGEKLLLTFATLNQIIALRAFARESDALQLH